MRNSCFLPIAFLVALLLTGASTARAASLAVSASEFRHANSSPVAFFDNFDGGWRVGANAGQATLIAPVKLPDGATVTAFTMYYLDNSAGFIECNLLRALNTASNHPGSNVLGATASTEEDTMDHSTTDTIIANALIDNSTYYYFVYVGMASDDGERRFLGAVIDYTEPVTAVGGEVLPAVGRASARPNPFKLNTSIRFSMQAAGPVTVDIYDLQGRVIRTIRNPFLPAGDNSLRWDGLDDHGRPAPGGVYFAQVKGLNEALAAKLVRVQ